MSLRPKLHVSTFHWRTVVSMIGRLCHLFVHALSSLQVANAQCMTLRSLAPCLRAAREKHRFAAGKKHRNGKKHVWQQEKNALQREKAISAAGKTPAKNAASQREKFKAAEKTPCSSTKAPLQQKKCILEAAGKNRPRREKTRPRQEKNRPRQEKNQQQRKSSFATQKVAATEKIHFRNGKKQQPPCRILRSFQDTALQKIITAISQFHLRIERIRFPQTFNTAVYSSLGARNKEEPLTASFWLPTKTNKTASCISTSFGGSVVSTEDGFA